MPGDRRVARQRHHGVAVAAQHEGVGVLDRDAQLHRDEGAHAGAVEDARHPEDAVLGQAGDPVGHLAHRVERVRDHHQDRVRRVLEGVLGAVLDDLVVRVEQVVAAHPGLARDAGGDHHDVGAGGVLVVVRADHAGIGALDRRRLHDVEALALRHAFDDVDEHDVGQLAIRKALREGGSDVSSADDRDFAIHASPSGPRPGILLPCGPKRHALDPNALLRGLAKAPSRWMPRSRRAASHRAPTQRGTCTAPARD